MNQVSDFYSKAIRLALFVFLFFLPLVILPGAMHKFAIAKLTLFRVTVMTVLVLWLVKAISERNVEIRRNSMDLPILFFLAANIIATYLSLSPTTSVMGAFFQRQEGLITLLGYGALFYAVGHFFKEKEDLLTAVKVVAFSSILVSLYGLAQYLGYDVFSYRLLELEKVRSFSTLGNPDLLGSYLVLVLPLNLGLVVAARSPREYSLAITAFLLSVLALVFTFTRGAWLGALAGLLIMVFSAACIRSLRRKVVALCIMLVLALGTVAAFSLVGASRGFSLRDRIVSLVDFHQGSTAEARLLMWSDSLKVIKARPLSGWGPETFKDVFVRYRSLELAKGGGKRSYVERPHNQTLYAAASAGVLGVIAYIWLITGFLFLMVTRLNSGDASLPGLKIGVLASGIGYFIQEQFLFSFVSVTPLFWMVLGFAVCLAEEPNVRKVDLTLGFLPRRSSPFVFGLTILGLALFVLSLLLMNADLEAGKGRDAIAAGNLPVAASFLERAVTLNPWEPRYRYYLGAVYTDMGLQSGRVFWLGQAEEVYQRGLRINPYDSLLSKGLGDVYYRISQLGNYPDFALALRAYTRTVEIDPFSAEAHLGLGNIFLSQKKWNKALEHFRAALQISPHDAEALTGIARVHEGRGEAGKAQQYFRRALEYDAGNQAALEGIERVMGDQ